MTPHFIKLINSEKMESLLQDYPNAFLLLQHIARRIDTNTQEATIYPSLVKKMKKDEFRAALEILIKKSIIEVRETKQGNGGHRVIRIISQEIVDTTMQKTVPKNTPNYEVLRATNTLGTRKAHVEDTLDALSLHVENLVNNSLSISYERLLHVKNTLDALSQQVTNLYSTCTLENNIDIIDNKEIDVVLQTTSLKVSNSIPKQKKKKAPPVADTPPTEKSLRQKISDMFCLGWYPQKYIVQGQPKEYEFKKSQDGKNLNEIENKLKTEVAKVKKREGTEQEILLCFDFILKYGANNHWANHITLQFLNSRFSEFYIKADEIYKKEKAEEKAKKQSPTVQSFDKTKTGEAKRLAKEHEKWLAEETAKRAATKQAGE